MTTLWLAAALLRNTQTPARRTPDAINLGRGAFARAPSPAPAGEGGEGVAAKRRGEATPQTPPAQTPPGQTPAAGYSQAQLGQKPPIAPGQHPVTAFPGSPMQHPARVKDIAVPPPIPAPGAENGQIIGENAPLTADEAVRIALHQQPSLGVQQGAITTRQGQTAEAGAPLHPIVSVGAGYDNVQTLDHLPPQTIAQAPSLLIPSGSSATNSYSGNAGIRQLLFDFNMTRNLVRQSEALEKSATQDLSTAQLSLANTVKSDFYNYVSAIRVVHVNEENVTNRQRQLDLAASRYRNGIGEPSDLATAQTSKSQGIIQLNQARNTAEHARISLLQQMGIDPLTPVIPADEAAPETNSDNARALADKAVKARPEVKSAFLSVIAAKYGLSAAKATNLPQIYAELGSSANGNNFPLDDNVANFAVGFQFPLSDGGYRAGAVKAAKGQIATALANYETAMLQVRTDVANAFADLKSAEQRVVAADNEVFNAREDVRVAEGRYQIGIGLFQDITTAQSLLLTAETDQESARNSVDLARTQLLRAVGDLIH